MTNREFYTSKKWERKRAAILRRDRYICQESKRYGKIRQADTVHHIFPLKDFPELALKDWNLISLSNEMHNKMHDRNTGELTEKGKELQKRIAKKYLPEK